MKWILARIAEPSSWAAAGICAIGIAAIIGQPALMFIALAAAIAAFILKDKGGEL
jgi:type III secretory pathway component EscV|tara:strand:- start:1371 stop:1535 length:165 start_codon:yes stop_codon:yes gene_type:complete